MLVRLGKPDLLIRRFIVTRITPALLLPAVLLLPVQAGDTSINKPPRAFIALFNGKDLAGWQGLVQINKRAKTSPEELKKAQDDAGKRFLPHWTVNNGILEYDGKGNNLQTCQVFTIEKSDEAARGFVDA